MICLSKKLAGLLVVITLIWMPDGVIAGQKPISVDIGGEKAEATFIKGKAFRVREDLPPGSSLVKGDFLHQGERFSTQKASRIELKLPDGSFLRFGAQTTFELASLAHDEQNKELSIDVKMLLGKTWAKVSKYVGRKRRFEISTKTAVMGVRGTVYRVNVEKDDTVIVKVYWGEILVDSKSKPAPAAPQRGKTVGPSKVLGPQPIAGPRAVSMKEWTAIVKSMQQITIRPDGTMTKPFRFSPEEDSNDWVEWNKQRDAEAGGEQE
ncbi:MAG: FecR family protein [Desulfobacterales bacterium]